MEKIFTVVEVAEGKKVNIGTYYLTSELTFGGKDKLVGLGFT